MGSLLFSPSGRIGPSAYMKGIMIYAIIGFALSILVALAPMLGLLALPIGLLLFYIFIALGIKRSHDAGKSGWLVITHILLSWGVATAVGFVIGMVTGVSVSDTFSAAFSGDTEAMEAATAATQTLSYGLISGIGGVVGALVTGYLVNMFNKSDPGDNLSLIHI